MGDYDDDAVSLLSLIMCYSQLDEEVYGILYGELKVFRLRIGTFIQ